MIMVLMLKKTDGQLGFHFRMFFQLHFCVVLFLSVPATLRLRSLLFRDVFISSPNPNTIVVTFKNFFIVVP